ncbi:hypothetical protein SLA2020_427550 [Shorea laevis]
MLVPGILGFQSIVVGLLLILCLVIRQKWKNAAERKEEVRRLLAMASQEAVMVEAQSMAEYSGGYLKPYQCAVCFCPTTTRCSRCKSVHYCSGKCQIIHWRQGHKDECHPQTDFPTQKLFRIYSDDSGVEGEFKASPNASLPEGEDDDGERARGIPMKFATSSASPLADSTLSNDFAPDMPKSAARPEKIREAILRSETDHVDNMSDLSKKNKLVHNDEEVEFRMQLGSKTLMDDVHPTKEMNKNLVKETSSEMLVTEASKKKSLPSSSLSRPHFVTNDREEKNARHSSCDATSDHPSSSARGHLITGSKSVTANCNGLPSLPQTACNGLKTSMQKVVQQFRSSKQSKSYLLGSENEVTQKYNCKIIFPYELFVELYSYDAVELCPFGLTNCGNSCYANAVLQSLAFTRPLTSYLVRGLHSRSCRKKDWCFICEFECLILKATEGESLLSPIRILSKIKKIGSHLSHGKEEDAHEFLRYAVDTMQSVCLKEAGAVGPLAEETTLVGLTFGGYLRSKIKCMKCLGKSERFERMMDLTVEIDGNIGTLDEALSQFTATEILDGDNKYHCSRCKSYVKAKKKLTVSEAPNILTIVLKRFQSGNFGKLNKSIRFPGVLNMDPYMSGTTDKSNVYGLYAVVVHLDVMNTAVSGHYVCYVRDFHGGWFRIDDSTVIPVELESVLLERAYMLLYARHSPRTPALVKSTLESHGVRSKKRDQEAVPSSSKMRLDSYISNADPRKAQQKHGKHVYWITSDGSTSKQLQYLEDWRFHPPRRIPSADSWSESSSLFSSSDASSCSTTSTKDSVRSEDFSDYIFGDMGHEWYKPISDAIESERV